MKVFVIGGGGREHTIVWKVKRSPLVNKVYCAPGNAGIMQDAECVDISVMDSETLLKFAIKEKIDLTIVGPEAPLVNGIVDVFEENGMAIFGPSQRAAGLEGSKAFCKNLLSKYEIPTADYRVFKEYDAARSFLLKQNGPVVVKADGLAAGKGALVCKSREESLVALDKMMKKREFGAAGDKVVIEECLVGDEVSVMAISDGENFVTLLPSQDHKRIFDNNQGPNTGGMGAFAPTPHIPSDIMQRIEKEIIGPTIKAMALDGFPYKGLLYAGLMITRDGPKVIEYNVRFGDPETQVVLPMAESDLVEAILAARQGKLADVKWVNKPGGAVCVVLASGGYPGHFEKGKKIHGLDHQWDDGLYVFHAGTRRQGQDIVTNGGRVLGLTAVDTSISRAVDKVYHAMKWIVFDGAYYRRDIAARVLK
ncbi:phosphoribosylamine--glycine ligase [candidate division KSB1 bacterium]|nr:phosphoribosylamine--glycine ligase [candidate division KSB1 bacterium]RQV99887.1 MAG: phosphoribosylamine--glycine ligase [candidate division KSB1 bacterium]